MAERHEQAGRAVALAAVAAAQERLGARLASAYLIGSLAHGGFSPVSDVDVALLTTPGPGVADEVAVIAARVRAEQTYPFAERLSVFHASWPLDGPPGHDARFPAIDRLDLLEHGVLVAGEDRRAEATRPSRKELAGEACAFTAARADLAGLREASVADLGARGTTKLVLAPVRLLAVVLGGEVGGNDAQAAYAPAAHRPLVDAALAWRRTGWIEDVAGAQALVDRHLVPLHAEAFAATGEEALALLAARLRG